MKKLIATGLVAVLVLTLAIGGVVWGSNGQPAAKVTAKVGDVSALGVNDTTWTTILSNSIKVPSQKDLFIDVSLQCGLYTQTKVKSKSGVPDESMAMAAVDVRVLVDSRVAEPGQVTFAARTQTVNATFMGLLNLTATPPVVTGNETLELILDTMSANSFNFIVDDLVSGEYTISVQAKFNTDTASQLGSATAVATVGLGSVTVETVRMIQDEDILLE